MESTLTAAWTDLLGDVGFFLGYGRGPAFGEVAWTSQKQAAIDRCVKGGLRKFYYCGYDWSFLKPVANLVLPTSERTIPMPDDFGGFEGRITISAPAGQTWWALDLMGIGDVYNKEGQLPTMTARPQMACLEPLKGTGPSQGSRFQLRIFPLADMAYTLRFQYYIHPDYLSGAFPYAYGGPQYAETLLESCLAVAEKILDDGSGIHDAAFKELLDQSVMIDRRSKPQTLGYNGDCSDSRGRDWRGPRHWGNNAITVNGTLYA